MARKTGLLSILVLGVVLVVLGACGKETPLTGGTDNEPPKTKTFTEKEWSIVTPAGWTRTDWTSKADAKQAIRYADANGNYVIVNIDPLGSDFSYDTVWTYAVKGLGFDITGKVGCSSANDPYCTDKDTSYTGYAMWKSGTTPAKVGGHVFYFTFGNTNTKTVDVASYETIIESVRAIA